MPENTTPEPLDPQTDAAMKAARIPAAMVEEMSAFVALQSVTRPAGVPDLRETSVGVGVAPYPAMDNVTFQYLLQAARQMLEHGADPMTVVVNTAANSWFEGHIEGAYSR